MKCQISIVFFCCNYLYCFNFQGERFDWPEKVPFRLTHNLVNAMGPTGVEGVFRHSCEITTRVMRQQIDQLMSVVRPFCYDPLVTWNTNHNSRDENAEMTNEKVCLMNVCVLSVGQIVTFYNKSSIKKTCEFKYFLTWVL